MSNLVLCPFHPLKISHLAHRPGRGSPNGRGGAFEPAFLRRKCLPIFEQPPSIGCTFTSTEAMPLRRKVVDDKVDWSKAPEMATHACVSVTLFPWRMKDERGRWHFWVRREWFPARPDENAILVQRPVTPAWTGEGLPPVGIECLLMWTFQHGGSIYVKVRVLAHDDGRAVVRVIEGDNSGALRENSGGDCGGQKIFKPIRTPEQIAAEEREKELRQIEDTISSMVNRDSRRDAAEALYDAGYRKDPRTADLLRALKDIATSGEESTVLGLKTVAALALAAVEGGAA